MKAGSLNRQATIDRRTAGKGPSGQPLTTWTPLGTLWADVAHDTGKAAIRQSGDVPVPYVRYSFRVRFQAAKNLGVGMAAYERTVADWQSTKGASATPGRASQRPSKGKQRGKASVPNPAL